MTHHSVMMLSLRDDILNIDKFCDFSYDFDYISMADVFRDFISLIINQRDPRRSKAVSGVHKVSINRACNFSILRDRY